MVAEELLFWLAPIDASQDRAGVLCRRHADAMVVPRGWTLDDRRNGGPRLFQAERFAHHGPPVPAVPRHRTRRAAARVEQLVIDGTGEIARPAVLPPEPESERHPAPAPAAQVSVPVAPVEAPADPEPEPDAPWLPRFDTDDDLGGVLDVRSPLLSRAFRGTDLRR